MRYIKLFKVLCLLSAFVLLASCGGGTGGGAGTSTVTIAIGGTGLASVIEQQENTLFAGIVDLFTPNKAMAQQNGCYFPPDVHRIEFEIIEGLGLAPQQRTVIADGRCPLIEEFTVRNGNGIIFNADEYSESGDHLYTGSTIQNISGPDHVRIIMRNAGTCSRNFTFEINPGTYALYMFSATSLTESIDVHLTSDQESQLSLIDINGSSIVCDPVCGSTNFDTNLNITHQFTAPGWYGIKVGNFGSAVGNYALDVTMAGDETICDSIVSIDACLTDADCPPDRMCVEGFCEPKVEPVCGNGSLDPGEECDDGNTFDGDGCSANCTLEPECADVSGAWTLFVSNITSTCGPEEPWSSDITISQTGCTLEAVGIKGSTFPVSGSIVGNAGTLGPASFPEGFGTTTATYSGTLQPDGTITGNESWTWVGEGPSCIDGTADITLTRWVTPGDPCAGVVCDSGFTCIDGVCIEGSAKNLVGPDTSLTCEGAGVGYTTVVDLGADGLRVDVEFTNGPPNSSSTVYWVCTNVPGGCHGSACGFITLGTITTDSNGQGFFSTVLPDGNPYPGKYVHFDLLGGGGSFTSVTHLEIFPVPGGSAAIAAAGMSMEEGIGDPTD